MTIETQTTDVTANGDDSNKVFSFSPMVIYASTELEVTVIDSSGDETTILKGASSTTYSVGITSYPDTGSITYPAVGGTALATGAKINIKKKLTLEQQTDLENQGGYFSEVTEKQFDKFIGIDLQQQEEIDRTLKLRRSDVSGVATEIIDIPAASEVLQVNAAGTGLVWSTLATLGAVPNPVTVAYGGTGAVTAAAAIAALGGLPLAGGAMTGNITMAGSQTVDGRDLSADGTKLDTVETSATADQTNAEIATAVEAATDSNTFTDADHSKLNGIEAAADVTDVTNVTAAGALIASNNFSDIGTLATALTNLGLGTTDTPEFANLNLQGKTLFVLHLNLSNASGTLKHSEYRDASNLAIGDYGAGLNNATTTITTTPTGADASTAMAAGGKISTGSTAAFILDTDAVVAADTFLIANLIKVTVSPTDTVFVRPEAISRDVNGTTLRRFELFHMDDAGVNFALNTTNIASGKSFTYQLIGMLA